MLLPLQIFFANGGASPLDRARYLFLFWLSGSGYTIAMKVCNNNCRFLLQYFLNSSLTDLTHHHLPDLLVLESCLHLALPMEISSTVGGVPYIYKPVTPSSVWLISAAAGELPASSPVNGKIKHCRRGTLHIQTCHTIICLADLCCCWRVACI